MVFSPQSPIHVRQRPLGPCTVARGSQNSFALFLQPEIRLARNSRRPAESSRPAHLLQQTSPPQEDSRPPAPSHPPHPHAIHLTVHSGEHSGSLFSLKMNLTYVFGMWSLRLLLHHVCVWCPQRPERPPGTGVHVAMSIMWVLGIEPGSSERVASAFNC